jgi:general secretion pathway protein G
MESEENCQRKISYSAILSLILGLAGIITFGLSAVLGLVLGIVTWRSIRRSKGRLGGQAIAAAGMAISGIVSVTIAIFFLGVILSFESNAKEARLNAAMADVRNYATALDLFELDNGFYPTSEQELQALVTLPKSQPLAVNWKGPYLAQMRLRNDPWGKPYVYKLPGTRNINSFDLYSAGPNRIYGDNDDVIFSQK